MNKTNSTFKLYLSFATFAAVSATWCSGPAITPTLIDVAAGAVDAASAFFSSLQPVNTNADAIAVIANKFFNFMFFPCCE